MLDALRNLKKEINAIIALLRNTPLSISANSPIAERVQELVLTWSVVVRPNLAALKIPYEVLDHADVLTSRAARLTGKPSPKAKYLSTLHAIRRVLMEQVLLEVARIPLALRLAVVDTVTENLFPEISDLPNQLVPNALQGWAQPIKSFLKKHPFDNNVFIMVSYRSELGPLIERVKRQLVTLGLNPVLAKDCTLTDDLYNPIACLLCCRFGVAIFGRAEAKQMHNPNVVYELGMMQLLKRRCVILKHAKLKKMPTDLLTRLYEDYSSQNQAVQKLTQWWARANI